VALKIVPLKLLSGLFFSPVLECNSPEDIIAHPALHVNPMLIRWPELPQLAGVHRETVDSQTLELAR
jgi:hypothetical protein